MTHSTAFLEMATRIDRDEGDFGGAIVVRTPDGRTVSHLLSSPDASPVVFWGFVKSVIEDAYRQFEESQTMSPMGFPRR